MRTRHPLEQQAIGLQALVCERAIAAERAGGPDREVVRAMADAGLFAMCAPQALGGAEADPLTTIAIIETIAQADGATGWVLMIGAETTGIGGAYFAKETSAALFAGERQVVICGALKILYDGLLLWTFRHVRPRAPLRSKSYQMPRPGSDHSAEDGRRASRPDGRCCWHWRRLPAN